MKRGRKDPSFGLGRAGRDVEREIRAHLALSVDELVADGRDAADAEAEALRAFGDPEAVLRACAREAEGDHHGVRGGMMFDTWRQDVGYAVRSLARRPAFAVVATVTLALGIGSNTAVFSVVDGVLLDPLPYAEPDRLVWIDEVSLRDRPMRAAWPNFVDWRAGTERFEGLAAFARAEPTLLGGAEPALVPGAVVSEDFWKVFPVVPVTGRLTLPEDHREGAAPALVVSAALARDVLDDAGAASVVGRAIEVGGRSFEVVGVVPATFDFPAGARHWTPLELDPQGESRTAHNWSVVGRLAAGADRRVAEQELDALQAKLAGTIAADALDYAGQEVRVVPLRDELVGEARTPLLVLLGAAGLVLLVACANLASQLLARGTARGRELAVRSALGATGSRLARQLLTESLVLSAVGAGAGLGLAAAAVATLRTYGRASVPRLDEVGVDGAALAFTAGVAVLATLAFGLLPAVRGAGRGAGSAALREGGRGETGARGRTWDLLVASEVALALVLLAGAGLLVRSFAKLLDEDAGFDGRGVVTATLAPGPSRHPTPADRVRFWDEVAARASALPGVSAAGVMGSLPLTSAPNGRISIDGVPDRYADALYVVAGPGALETLDVPLVRGRLFEASDGPGAPHVALVSEAFAERYWPGEDPLGRTVTGGGMDDWWDADPPVFGTVVGVVGDVRFSDLARPGGPTIYWSYRQRPYRTRFGATLVAESATGDARRLAEPLRRLVREADPDVPVRIRSMDEVLGSSVAERRFLFLVLGAFAAAAALLAGVGIYGVVSYSVARRTREMGVRLALGAAPASVVRLVLGGALRPVTAGLVVGVGAALATSRVLGSLLYEVEAHDPATFAGVTAALLATGAVASWIPALRGTRVDPSHAMRVE